MTLRCKGVRDIVIRFVRERFGKVTGHLLETTQVPTEFPILMSN
jgi:hypothetical protein